MERPSHGHGGNGRPGVARRGVQFGARENEAVTVLCEAAADQQSTVPEEGGRVSPAPLIHGCCRSPSVRRWVENIDADSRRDIAIDLSAADTACYQHTAVL